MSVSDDFVSNHAADYAAGDEVDIVTLPNSINKINSAAIDAT